MNSEKFIELKEGNQALVNAKNFESLLLHLKRNENMYTALF